MSIIDVSADASTLGKVATLAPVSNQDAAAVADANSNGISGKPSVPAAINVVPNPVTINPVTNKYLAAFIQIALVAFTAFVALGDAALSPTILIQLGIAVLGAVGVYLVPVLKSAWQGALKTGVAIVTAALAAVVPFVAGGPITWQDWIVVGGAALTALATEVGVQIRTATAQHVS